MKKIIPFLLIFFMFAGCNAKEHTPEIPKVFTQKAKVKSGDFLFECEICRTDDKVITTVNSTSATGMVMTYDGENLNFNYGNYSYDIDAAGFERSNVSIVVYEVFESIALYSQSDAKKVENGYRCFGKTTLGDFELIFNNDSTLRSITIKNANLEIEFV